MSFKVLCIHIGEKCDWTPFKVGDILTASPMPKRYHALLLINGVNPDDFYCIEEFTLNPEGIPVFWWRYWFCPLESNEDELAEYSNIEEENLITI